RPRAGREKQEQKAGVSEGRMRRLHEQTFREGEVVCSDEFSMQQHGSASSSGWQGQAPPKKIQEELRGLYESGEILQLLRVFFPIPYLQGTFLVDADGCVFTYCSFRAQWLHSQAGELSKATQALLSDALMDQSLEKKCKLRPCGPHFPCIIGHQRQYQWSADLTAFHKNNLAKVEVFMKAPIIIRINRWVEQVMWQVFPRVAKCFDESSSWYKKRGIVPLFGMYWNLCINASFPNQVQVHCGPHADQKNIVGICTLLVYELPGKNFNHTMRSWLVIWEAGVVIELPPWVLLLYPSSLLYHFNIDIHAIQFLATDGLQRPTPANSRPITAGDECSRGSLVYFNQATMYQTSETGYATIGEAVEAGDLGKVDYRMSAQAVFTKYAKYF
ncbi:hypothetical protein L208DRAFT_1055584, partial [Tricholoma matsutake]